MHDDHLEAVAVLKDHPDLEEKWREMLKIDAEADKKISEMQAMAKRLQDVANEKTAKIMAEIIEAAKKKNLLPQDLVDEETHQVYLHYGSLMVRPIIKGEAPCMCVPCRIRRAFEND